MTCEVIKVADTQSFVKIGSDQCEDGAQIVKVSESGVIVKVGNTILVGGTTDETELPFDGQDIETYPSGEGITAYQPVVLDNGQLFVADNTDSNHRGKFIGVALISVVSAGINVRVARSGLTTNSGWSFTAGSFVFIGSNGLLVEAPPATGFLQSIGHALNGTNLVLNIKQAIRRI